jgi:hypothetical protein
MVLKKLAVYMPKTKLDPHLSPCTKLNSNWIKDLNVRPETLELPQEKMGKFWKIQPR